MPIDYNILITYGGVAKKVRKGEYIFQEGAMPFYYYQVVEGKVKQYSSDDSGKELMQGTFTDGQSFGEPPLLLERCYPSTAEAATHSIIIRIRKEGFLSILKDFPEIAHQFLFCFAERIYNKATSAQIWLKSTPEERILQFFQQVKSSNSVDPDSPLPYTRQHIAVHTNLRTETVIRTLNRMAGEGKVCIRDHKIFLT